MTFGVTPEGFRAKRLPNIKLDLENALKAQFGEINVEPQSVFGQIIGVYSKVLADIWENLQDVYLSQYPNSAEGVALDNVVLLNGITRLPASRTIVNASLFGVNNALVPTGSQIKIPNTNTIFYNPADILISNTRANRASVIVTNLAAQIYTVVINNQSFRYALPLLSLVGSFVSGNTILVTINGTTLGPVGWTGNSASTNAAVAALIATHPDVAATGTPDGSTITVTPNNGKYVVIDAVTITGGGSQPSYTRGYSAPSAILEVINNLSFTINQGVQPVTSSVVGNNLIINSDDSTIPFSINLGANLTLNNLSSPGIFLAQEFGVVEAPSNSVTEIVTPINGWISVNNLTAGIPGRERETDAALRIRRLNSLRAFGAATVESIRARILQEVPGVSNVLVFENVSIQQTPTVIELSTQLITGNVVSVTIEGVALSNTPYSVSHLNTMSIIANKISLVDGVESATVGGINNQTLTINTQSGNYIFVDIFSVAGGASVPLINKSIGRPPKSFEVVVEGGTNLAIAQKIWQTKPAGVQTFGNVNDYDGVPITDSQGNTQFISFSRAVPIYIWANIQVSLYGGETFPPTGLQQIEAAVLAYGNTLGIGVDVLIQRVQAQVFTVPGVGSATVTLAATLNADGSPVYGSSNIVIGESSVSVWDASRITVSVV